MQFFAAADDELFERHAPKLALIIARTAKDTGESSRNFAKAVKALQEKTERTSFEVRRQVYQQQQWLDKVLTTIAEPSLSNKNTFSKQGEAA